MICTAPKAFLALLFATLSLSGCGNDPEAPGSKRIYSVLQHEEFELRQRKGRAPYVFAKRALDTEIDTIAFPLASAANGYVVFYATPEEGELILSVPQHYDIESDNADA